MRTPPAVRVWRIPLDVSPEQQLICLSGLSADEIVRAERYRVPDARRRFVVARSALREILAQQLGIAPLRVQFHYSTLGKPFIAQPNGSGLELSVAHSGDWGLVALARDRQLGVDLEIERPLDRLSSLMAQILSAEERSDVSELAPEAGLRMFYRYWVAKEAVGKASGEGIRRGAGAIRIGRGPPNGDCFTGQFDDHDSPESVSGRWFEAAPGYAAAVALLQFERPLSFEDLEVQTFGCAGG